jgi:hypothetical protein
MGFRVSFLTSARPPHDLRICGSLRKSLLTENNLRSAVRARLSTAAYPPQPQGSGCFAVATHPTPRLAAATNVIGMGKVC